MVAAGSPASAGALNAAVEHASALLGPDPSAARAEAAAILKVAPGDPRARLILASAHRRLGDPAAALSILVPLAKAYPRAAHTQYELGASRAARGQTAAAIEALRQAVSLNRDLAEAWRALGDQLFADGDGPGAERAFAEHQRATIRDPALKDAAEDLAAGRLSPAEDRLRTHLRARPNDVTALRLMADVLARLERHGDAETLLAHALALDPAHDGARFAYATALFHQQKAAEALPHVERLLALEPESVAYRNLLAACLSLTGDFNRVIETNDSLLAQFPKQAAIWLNQGHALRAVGRRQDAVRAYRRALDLAPNLGDAYWSLANLKVEPLSPRDEATIETQLRRADLAPMDRLHLRYALGKALEDRGAHQGAFENYAAAAGLRRQSLAYDPDELTDFVARSKARFTSSFFADRQGAGSPAKDPIFVVGLPRSGSTLIEQILASHSAVEGTMELSDIGIMAGGLRGVGGGVYPEILTALDSAALASLGAVFLDRTRIQRRLGRRHFIDKMPNNFRHTGFIHLILPNARIIDARRHPLGACFSAFKQHFAQGQAFSYDLGDLGRYYRDYVELMVHFDAVLPGRVHRVIYEDLVENTEAEIRRLLDHCGLPFEAGCLNFHQNDRAVRTVSSEQVRRPIFREGLDQWRSYEPWLGPLKHALGSALEDWRTG